VIWTEHVWVEQVHVALSALRIKYTHRTRAVGPGYYILRLRRSKKRKQKHPYTLQSVFLNLGQERFVANPENFGGARFISVFRHERLGNLFSFNYLHRALSRFTQQAGRVKAERGRFTCRLGAESQIARFEIGSVRENAGALDGILELAHVAWPAMCA